MGRQAIQSPCVKVCAVDGRTGLCVGCGRTLKEIGGWVQLGEAGRQAVMDALPDRLARLDQRQSRGTQTG